MKEIHTPQLLEEIFTILERINKLEPKINDQDAVTPLQLNALRFISEHHGATPGQLGGFLRITPSATTQLGDRMVALGYVERTQHNEDRRLTILQLTASGKKVFTTTLKKRRKHMQEVFSKMPEQDLRDLVRIYGTIEKILEERSR